MFSFYSILPFLISALHSTTIQTFKNIKSDFAVINDVQLPIETLANIIDFSGLAFNDSWDLVSKWKIPNQPHNPLFRTIFNPLTFYDERKGKVGRKSVIVKNVLDFPNDDKKLFLMKQLLHNPTIYLYPWKQMFLDVAAIIGDEELFKLLILRKINPDKDCLDKSFSARNKKVIEFLIQNCGLVPDIQTLVNVARIGDLELVKRIINDFNVDPRDTFDESLIGSILSQAFDIFPNDDLAHSVSTNSILAASASGNIDLLKYLIDFYGSLSYSTISSLMINSGNFETLKYLLEKYNVAPEKGAIDNAASRGDLETVKFLLTLDITPDIFTFNSALDGRRSKMAEFILNLGGITPDLSSLRILAGNGNLEYFKNLARRFNITPDLSTLQSAISSGNYKMIKYLTVFLQPTRLMLNSIPGISKINLKKKMQLMKHIVELGVVPDTTTITSCLESCFSDQFILVNFIVVKQKINPLHEHLNMAARNGNLELVNFLIKRGISPNQETVTAAFYSKNEDLLRELYRINPVVGWM